MSAVLSRAHAHAHVPVLQLAVVGAGPVGLALALSAARRLPSAQVCVYDRLSVDHDVSGDPRTLALSQGSVLELQRLGVWADMAERAEPILAVHVSQQQPGLLDLLGKAPAPELLMRAEDEGVPQLGAVIPYGALAAPMRAAWLAACAREPGRLSVRWGSAVSGVRTVPGGVEIDVGAASGAGGALVESHHLAVQVGMGEPVLILAFVVIVIGGIGSIKGAFIGALLVGLTSTLGGIFLPELFKLFTDPATAQSVGASLASMSIYILMSLVLIWRPTGLFGARA